MNNLTPKSASRRVHMIQSICFWLIIFLSAALLLERAHAAESAFRVAFSVSLFTEINENDAKASVRGWAQTVARQRNIPTDPDTSILKGVPEMLRALLDHKVDAVGVSAIEYAALRNEVRFDPIFVTYVGPRVAEQYLLLVHQDSGINGLGDLRGRTMSLHQNVRSCLAQPWVDTLLVQQGFKPVAEFTSRITLNPKISRTVLPVFFRQSDACLATRSGFETMVELNPQLGKQLKVLAKSPEIVPAVFCFRADYAPAFKADLLAGMRELHLTPVGQQVLTVFQSDKIEEQPASFLDGTLELLATHQRLCPQTNAPRPALTNTVAPLLETDKGGRK